MYTQLVIVTYKESADSFMYRINSDSPITVRKVEDYFNTTEGFNSDVMGDCITFIDEPFTEITID